MRKKIVENSAAQMIPLLFAILDRVVLLAVFLRALGQDAYADWITIFSVSGLLSLGEFGLNLYFGNQLQKANALSDPGNVQRFFSLSLGLYLIVCGVLGLGLIIFVIVAPLKQILELDLFSEQEASWVMCGLGLTVLLRMLRGCVSQVYRGHQRFARGTVIFDISNVVSVITMVAMALVGFSAPSLALVGLIVEILFAFPMLIFDIRRSFPKLRIQPLLPTWMDISDTIALGKWIAIVQSVPILWLQLPILFASRIAESSAIIVSFVSMRILSNFVRTLIELFTRSYSVEVVPLFHNSQLEQLNRHINLFGTFSTGLVALIFGYLTIFAEPLLDLWTGQGGLYDPGIFFLLLLPTLAVCPVLPLRMIFELSNEPRISAIALMIQICLFVLLFLVIPGTDELLRLVLALALAEIIGFLGFMLRRINTLINLPIGRYLFSCLLYFVTVYPIALIAAWSSFRLFPPVDVISFIGSSIVWGVLLMPAVAAVLWFRKKSRTI